MGVVYKLKEEVIQFIIAHKQNDPFLSCRKMVSLVNEHYQVEVSKSSVNAVFKQAQLSSPVGRRRKAPASKFFTIPPDKKEILLKNVAPLLTSVVAPLEERLPEPPVVVEPLPVVPQALRLVETASIERDTSSDELAPESAVDQEPVVVALPEAPLSLAPDILHVSQEESPAVNSILSQVNDDEASDRPFWFGDLGILYERAGVLVPVAVARQAVLGLGLGKALALRWGQDDSATMSVLLEEVFLSALFIGDPALLFEGEQGPLEALGISRGQAQEWLARFAELKRDTTWQAWWDSMVKTAGIRIEEVRCRLSDGQSIVLPSPHGKGWGFLTSAVARVADQVVTNTVPFMIGRVLTGLTDKATLDILSVFHGAQAIVSVELMTAQGDKAYVFDWTLPGGRSILVGVDLQEADLGQIETDTIANSQVFVDPFTGRKLSFLEGRLPDRAGLPDIRVVVLSGHEGSSRRALLTNIKGSLRDILLTYFRSFEVESNPNKEEKIRFSGNHYNKADENSLLCGNPEQENSAGDIYYTFYHLIHNHVISRNPDFEAQNSWPALLNCRGALRATPQAQLLRFVLESPGCALGELRQTLSSLNAECLRARDGSAWHFSCA